MKKLPTAHSELGASKAERWMNCAGSVRMCRGIPETSSPYAQEGSAAHDLGARALRKKLPADTWVDTIIGGEQVTLEMCEAVQVYVDHVRERQKKLRAARLFIEQTFDLAPLSPPGPMFGTADTVLVYKGGVHIEVIDYKHGRGVVVDPTENAQLMYYCLGAVVGLRDLLKAKPETFTVTIVQPRAFHAGGIVRSFDFDYEALVAFKHKLFDRAVKTGAPDAPLVVGSWCQFCLALPVCPAQEDHATSVAQAEFSTLPATMPPAPEVMTEQQLATVLDKGSIIEDWLRAVSAHVLGLLEAGVEVPGYKLVPKRATRKWIDEEAAVEWVEASGYDPLRSVVKSPAQIEKDIKEKLPRGKKKQAAEMIGHLVEKISSGNTLAPTADARPAVTGTTAEDEFTALPQGDGTN